MEAEGEMFIKTFSGASRGMPLTLGFEVCSRYKWLQTDPFYVSCFVLEKFPLEMSSVTESSALTRCQASVNRGTCGYPF